MTSPVDRTRWIERRGTAILFYDLAGIDDTKEGLRVITAFATFDSLDAARDWLVEERPPATVSGAGSR